MSMSKADLLNEFDAFTKAFRQKLVDSGEGQMSNHVVSIAVPRLVEAGIWSDKVVATFERMGASGRAFGTLTQGNKEAQSIIDAVLEELESKEPEPDKPKRGRPPKDKTEKADA